MTNRSISHSLFAFNALFEGADTLDDLHRLRDVRGGLDLFSIARVSQQQKTIAGLTGALEARDAMIARLHEAGA